QRASEPQQQDARPSVLAFALSPVLVRGGEAQTLKIPPGTDLVRLRLGVEQQDARRFQVSIRTDTGRQVWRQESIKPHRGGAGAAITINIPASRLALGDYILTLSAVNETGEPEEVNRYFFRVIRQ
ncbi:MAG TPA: hypothetical protein VNO14_04750, partial [Blastocatellia bacterium]|nr:hypothetical protein [Blastocatellia bacterium]